MKWERTLAIVAFWIAPAIGIWVTGESAVAWSWVLSYWATVEMK